MSQIDIRLEGFEAGAPGSPRLQDCRRFVAEALRELGAGDWELSILLCTDAFMRGLNRRYRGLEEPTDVLSFSQLQPAGEGGPAAKAGVPGFRPAGEKGSAARVAGDIVISLDTLGRNADREGESRETELKRLLIHGMLHLQGLDHSEEGASEMLLVQERLLEGLREKRIEI